MVPNRELASLLRQTAKRIRSQRVFWFDLDYQWLDSTRCNCGLLVREALKWDPDQLRQHTHRGTWQSIATLVYRQARHAPTTPPDPLLPEDPHCQTTGLKLGFVFNHMATLGFDSPQDFIHLEDLSDPVILERLRAKGTDPVVRYHAPHVGLYMNELADWIDQQLDEQARLQQLTQRIRVAKALAEPAVTQSVTLNS